jgi:hypothetical protein
MENNDLKSTMTYKAYYSDKSIQKEHNKGLGIPKQFAGGIRTCTIPFYKRLIKKNKVDKKIDYETWLKIVLLSNKKIAESILNTELGFRLPCGLGTLRIEGNKPSENKKVYVYNKNQKRVLARNLHSFGYMYSLNWLKGNEVRFNFRDIYDFSQTREVKKAMNLQIQKEFPYIKL